MLRGFQRASRGAPRVSQSEPLLRIVSYNVLADKWKGAHSYVPPELLAWAHRGPAILAQLDAWRPDLLALQEVEAAVYEQQLQPWAAARGYSSLFHPRQAAAAAPAPDDDGVSLLFKSDAFSQLAAQRVRFADHAAQLLPAACCGAHAPGSNRFLELVQAREEGALMALLRHEASGRSLLFVSTHLFWNPSFPDVKVAQAAILCSAISSFLRSHGGASSHGDSSSDQGSSSSSDDGDGGSSSSLEVPVVLAGDFNSLWRKYQSDAFDQVQPGRPLQSGVYQLLQRGVLRPGHHDHPAKRTCAHCSTGSSSGGDGGSSSTASGSGSSGGGGGGRSSSSPRARVKAAQHQQGQQQGQQQQEQQEQVVSHVFATSGLQLDSAHFLAHGREPALTTRTTTFSGTLDYVWLSRGDWHVTSTLQQPYDDPQQPGPPDCVPLDVLGPCPNAQHPSDHLPVGCEAVLLPARRRAAGKGGERRGKQQQQQQQRSPGQQGQHQEQ